MSHYITATGTLSYDSKLNLLESIQPLIKGGWLSKEGEEYIWRNEHGDAVMEENAVCDISNSLDIPDGYYRNITLVLDKVFEKVSSGNMKWYSTDGRYYLKSWVNGSVSKVDDPQVIFILANTNEQVDIDVLTMQSDEWEEKYDDCDFCEHLSDVMEAALKRF